MTWMSQPPLDVVFRRRENDGEPVNDRRLAARVAQGQMVRISSGSYADGASWRALTPAARHAQQAWEAAARLGPGRVFSHFAAAALHGIDILGSWPTTVDVSIDSASGGRSTGSIRRHPRDLAIADITPWGLHAVTTPRQTVVDLVSRLRFLEAVVVADRALWVRRPGGALVERDDLLAAAHDSRRAARAVEFSTHESDSVRETQSRVLIWRMGFPAPELQARFRLSNGTAAFTDFFWRSQRHIGEFDGVGKYLDPALLRGRTTEEVVIAEKDRQDDLRRQVDAFSRWRTPALDSPKKLYDILRGAGLPTSLPRPGR